MSFNDQLQYGIKYDKIGLRNDRLPGKLTGNLAIKVSTPSPNTGAIRTIERLMGLEIAFNNENSAPVQLWYALKPSRHQVLGDPEQIILKRTYGRKKKRFKGSTRHALSLLRCRTRATRKNDKKRSSVH